MVIVSRGGVGQGNGSGNRGPVEGLHGRVRQEPPGLVASPVRERQVPGEQAARQDHRKVGWAVQPAAAAGRQASQCVGGAVQYFAAERVVSAEHSGHVRGPHVKARVVVEALQQGPLVRAAGRVQKIARQRTRRCPVVVAAQYLAHRLLDDPVAAALISQEPAPSADGALVSGVAADAVASI